MFDPYHRWLAIPPDQRPPTLYQLLGVAPTETDRAVIEEAALRQASHVRIYQTGQYAQQSTKLLNEIGQARATLLNADKRREYDARLGAVRASPPPIPPADLLASAESPAVEREETPAGFLTLPARRSSGSPLLPALGYGAVLLLGGAMTFRLALARPGENSVPESQPTPVGKPALPSVTAPPKQSGEGRLLSSQEAAVYALCISPDGKSVLSAGGGFAGGVEGEPVGCAPRLWSLRTPKVVRAFPGPRTPVVALALSPGGQRFLAASGGYEWNDDSPVPIDCVVRLWDVPGGKELQTFTKHPAPVTGAAMHPYDDRVVSCSRDGTVWLWNTRGDPPPRRLDCGPFPATCAAVSPDGQYALVGGGDGSLHLWELRTGKDVGHFPRGESPILAVAFGPDGQIASAGGAVEYPKGQLVAKDCVVRVWDRASGKVLQTLQGHTRPVRAVAFAPGGKAILSGGLDKIVVLWETKSGKRLNRLRGPTAGVTSLVVVEKVVEKKDEVLAGALDGTIWGWDLLDGPDRDEAGP